MDTPIVLFDGVCNLCNAAVQWILQREQRPELKFAPLQGTHAAALLASAGMMQSDEAHRFKSIVFISEAGRIYTASDAVLQICRYLRQPWRWLAWLRWVPRPVRDAVYGLIARRRYQWFGKRTHCMIPSPELHARFFD